MAEPRISIVTPSLNQGRYLERTLRSVLDQEYPNLEYLVIDGGSTDESVSILERYDSRLAYWVSESDRGQAHAINKGLDAATGDIVAYINSDDYLLPGSLSEVAAAGEDSRISWIAGRCRYEFADGSLETLYQPQLPEGPPRRWLQSLWYVPQASSFWRREVFDQHGALRDDLSFVFDTEFGLRLALAGVLPHVIDRTLAVRYLHDEAKSADKSRFDDEWADVVKQLRSRLTKREAFLDTGERILRRLHAALP
jgi:glycosyltransferase involved in cell wall biosynthesis